MESKLEPNYTKSKYFNSIRRLHSFLLPHPQCTCCHVYSTMCSYFCTTSCFFLLSLIYVSICLLVHLNLLVSNVISCHVGYIAFFPIIYVSLANYYHSGCLCQPLCSTTRHFDLKHWSLFVEHPSFSLIAWM